MHLGAAGNKFPPSCFDSERTGVDPHHADRPDHGQSARRGLFRLHEAVVGSSSDSSNHLAPALWYSSCWENSCLSILRLWVLLPQVPWPLGNVYLIIQQLQVRELRLHHEDGIVFPCCLDSSIISDIYSSPFTFIILAHFRMQALLFRVVLQLSLEHFWPLQNSV